MQRFHFQPLSFLLGIASGIVILMIIAGGMRLVGGGRGAPGRSPNGFGQAQNGAPSISRMAERFGMTEADLQKELDSGKTIQQVAQERGVPSGGRGGASVSSPTSSGSTSVQGNISSASAAVSSSVGN